MRKIALILVLVSFHTVKGQHYTGFHSDNYNGIHGVISNPASIVDSRMKIDVNLLSLDGLISNNYYGIKLKQLFDGEDDNFIRGRRTLSADNNFISNINALGPSIMYTIDEKNAVALSTRQRVYGNLLNVNGLLVEVLSDGFSGQSNLSIILAPDLIFNEHRWNEYGATFARVLKEDGAHFFKGGITVKLLQGIENAYASIIDDESNPADDLNINYQVATEQLTTRGTLEYASSENFEGRIDKFSNDFSFDNLGIGIDAGLVYEWRPNSEDYTMSGKDGQTYIDEGKNKYLLRVGLSVTDIGAITYKDSESSIYNLAKLNFPASNFERSIPDILENEYTPSSTERTDIKAILPTALHANIDWKVQEKWYLNLNTDVALTGAEKNTSKALTNVSVTPRMETKKYSIYSPLSYDTYRNFSWGAGFRFGPVFVGSGTIITHLLSSEGSNRVDLYAGVKLPIYKGQSDRDKDGVIDIADQCPDVPGSKESHGCPDVDGDGVIDEDDDCIQDPGPVENNGCPWGDTDGDGIYDNEDNCIEEAGPAATNGCPDTDGDGVADKDDDCPKIAGPIETKGCPDTDGDTLLDNVDQCPEIAGTVANNGCPEVTEEVQKTLNDYAKTILFDSGKSVIKDESISVLRSIIAILNEYANAKFVVEGHTDSVGRESTNQRLSDSRANAVKEYLTTNGVDPFRLSSKGYGESNPIASNKTRSGRTQNRRVEINLVK